MAQPDEYKARYQGLMGLVRMLMRQGSGGVLPGSASSNTPATNRVSSGDPTYGRRGPNMDAMRAELDPNHRMSLIEDEIAAIRAQAQQPRRRK